jgi:hypothetical protein
MLDRTTMNMAAKRGLDLWFYRSCVDSAVENRLMVSLVESDDDSHVTYRVKDDGFYFDRAWGVDSEEWPNWIQGAWHIRLLLDAMSLVLRG